MVQKPGAAVPLVRARVHTITISANTSVYATVTSDDVDVLSASVTENKDVWYENLQRQELIEKVRDYLSIYTARQQYLPFANPLLLLNLTQHRLSPSAYPDSPVDAYPLSGYAPTHAPSLCSDPYTLRRVPPSRAPTKVPIPALTTPEPAPAVP